MSMLSLRTQMVPEVESIKFQLENRTILTDFVELTQAPPKGGTPWAGWKP